MKVQFLKRENLQNAGDTACSPLQYFLFKTRTTQICIHRLFGSRSLSHRLPIVVGGGGLDYWRSKIQRLVEHKRTTLIAWGMGLNTHWVSEKDDYPAFYDAFDLIGVRDFNKRFAYVPCVSALHPYLRETSSPRERIVLYEHAEHPLPIQGFPRLSNSVSPREAIRFLTQGEFVITNTYHGVYWATLLGKKAMLIPLENSSRFFFFKYPPVYTSIETWQKDLERAVTFPDSLEECIDLNLQFARKVANRLDIRILTRVVF